MTKNTIAAAAMTERLIEAAVAYEKAEGIYSASARRELSEARSAIEGAVAKTEVLEALKTHNCRECAGRGCIETGEMKKGVGGWGYESATCAACNGTGEDRIWERDLISRKAVLFVLDGWLTDIGGGGFGPDPVYALKSTRDKVEEMDSAAMRADVPSPGT